MKVSVTDLVKCLMCIAFILNEKCVANYVDFGDMPDKLDDMVLQLEPVYRISEKYKAKSLAWQKYEFESGIGNREELLIRNIEIWQDFIILSDIQNKQILKHKNEIYVAGIKENNVLLYHFNVETHHIASIAHIKTTRILKTFKIVNLSQMIDKSLESDIIVILSVEDNNQNQYLELFGFLGNSVVQLWTNKLEKRLKQLEYFYVKGQHKLLLLYENHKVFNQFFALVEIYDIEINEQSSKLQLCHQSLESETLGLQVCAQQGERIIISLLSKDRIALYEYKDDHIVKCTFKKIQNITEKNLISAICFQSGGTDYLATLGLTTNLYKLIKNSYLFDQNMAKNLYEIGTAKTIRYLPVDTYRDEVLLLIQSKNSSINAFTWNGINFKRLFFKDQNINQFDLSNAIMIPKFGFLIGTFFVKFNVKLNTLSKPIKNDIESMIDIKSTLQDLLEKQDKVIAKNNEIFQSYLSNSKVLNVSNANNFITKFDNFSITFQSRNTTLYEMQINYKNAIETVRLIEKQFNEIEKTLTNITTDITNTKIELDEINYNGYLNVRGALIVNNLTIGNINNISMKSIIDQCLNNNIKIIGKKSFPTIMFRNNKLKLKYLNGIALNNLVVEEVNVNYGDINLSKISKLEIKKNLNLSKIQDINWDELTQNLVFTNKKKFVSGSTVIIGQMDVEHLRLDYLNGLQYPYNYVLKSDPEEADITSSKMFQSIKVSDLQDLKTINKIDADEFIILTANQTLEHEITFENLKIDESFQVDDNIIGLPEQDNTLQNSKSVQSNTIFTNLYVSGNVYVENSINGTDWLKLQDLILVDDGDVLISGTKKFAENVHIVGNFEIKTEKINNRSIRDLITLDTRQILPNLSKITGNIKFTDVTYEELKTLEEKVIFNLNTKGDTACMKKSLVFIALPIIDKFSSLYINENLTGSDFMNKIEWLLQNTYFEHLQVKKIISDNLTPINVNRINIKKFKSQKILKVGYQILSGNAIIENLEVKKLYTKLVNNKSGGYLENLANKMDSLYESLFNGSLSVDSIIVTEHIVTSKMNEEDLNDILDMDVREEFSYRSNQSIENIVVGGLINKINFTERVKNTVIISENHVILKGLKKIKKLKANQLKIEFINGHFADEIISSNTSQILVGPVKILGSVSIDKAFDSNGKLNDVFFEDIMKAVHKLDENLFKLNGDFLVTNKSLINDLNVYGYIQQKNADKFMENIIFLKEEMILVTGNKTFENYVSFHSNISVSKNLNEIDFETFFESAVFVNKQTERIPVVLNSKIVFNCDILVEGDLVVENNLLVTAIKGIDIDDLMENAVYLNRPTLIAESIALSNVIFKSDITVQVWNHVELDRLFVLNKDETIGDTIMCIDVLVLDFHLNGLINGENLTEIYDNTLMLSTNQNISGISSFLNSIHIQRDLNSQIINEIDFENLIMLKKADQMNGDFVFHNFIIFKNNVNLSGNLNGIQLQSRISSVVRTNYETELIILGDWVITDSLILEKNFYGSGFINKASITKVSEDMTMQKKEVQYSVSKQMEKLNIICKELKELKNRVEHVLYKFKSFDYLRVLDFDQIILSIHHFELDNVDYIMVNFESCNLDVFAYANDGFMLAAKISNFGYVKQYITLEYKNNLYFVTFGKSECGRSSGNLWRLENYEFQHILSLGNITDVQQLDNDAFAIVIDHEVQEWSIENIWKNLFVPVNVISISDRNVQFFTNENETLLASRDTIFDLRSEVLEFDEYDNPFNTNDILTFQVGIFRKDYILLFDDRLSEDYIYLCNNDLSQRKVLQTIKAHKPSSFLIMNFDGFEENLLIYSENKRKIRIYKYEGINGFKYHSSINMKIDRLFNFKLRIHQYNTKIHCIAILQGKRLTILKATMVGDKLNTSNKLYCDTV